MKILVITFSADMNPGTFMQALGVRTGLLEMFPGAEVEYLNFPNFKASRWGKLTVGKNDSFLTIVRQKSTAFLRMLKYRRDNAKLFRFTRRISMFDYDPADARELLSHYDLVCVGSDTILEEAVGGTSGQYSLAWCSSTLCNAPHIFFAASASPAHFADDAGITATLKEMVSGFRFIGLRDGLTASLFRDKMGISAERVVKQPDPSYLLDVSQFELKGYYARRIAQLRAKGRRIALCNFSKNFLYRKQIADMLRAEGFGVITTAYSPYADLCLSTVSAREWAGVFRLCDMTVTERFHDSVFALRNGCPVIAVDWEEKRFSESGDSKTYRILEDYGLEQFHFTFRKEEQLKDIISAFPGVMEAYKEKNVAAKAVRYAEQAHAMLHDIKAAVKNS